MRNYQNHQGQKPEIANLTDEELATINGILTIPQAIPDGKKNSDDPKEGQEDEVSSAA